MKELLLEQFCCLKVGHKPDVPIQVRQVYSSPTEPQVEIGSTQWLKQQDRNILQLQNLEPYNNIAFKNTKKLPKQPMVL